MEECDIKNVTLMFSTKFFDKLPFVASVVKDCKPNGLDDLLIIVKVLLLILQMSSIFSQIKC